MPCTNTASASTTAPSPGRTSVTRPSTYAFTSTASGAPRRMTCPVVALIDSTVPAAGAASSFLPKPKMPLERAIGWPAATVSPGLTSMSDGTSPAGTESCEATATGVTSPSM